MLTVDKDGLEPYYMQIYRQIADAIEQGLYHPGEQLTSLRRNAQALGVSRNTIEQAYQMLTQEGYVEAKPGSGYIVNNRDSKSHRISGFDDAYESSLTLLRELSSSPHTDAPYDFAYDRMDDTLFPYLQWVRASRDVLQGPHAADICHYGDARGLFELREQIAVYLMREEDIHAVPEQIVVMPTTHAAMETLLHLFDPRWTTVAMENPGYAVITNACHDMGFTVVPHSIYPDNRWDNFVNHDSGARLVYCTPASQYPTNAVMTLEDRKALVQWAHDNDAYLIEDAYCHEFRYQSSHLPSLHALDTKGRVIVMGTFSKALAPSLCISYLVYPPQLMLRWIDPPKILHPPVSWHTQATLSTFIREGHWYQHLHRMQTAYRRKHDAIVEALDDTMGSKITYIDQETGLHVLLTTNDDRSSEELHRLAAKAGVRLYRTEHTFIGDVPSDWRFLLMGFGGITLDKIRPGIETLAKAWGF